MEEYVQWYSEINAEEELHQGDILLQCPILVPDPKFDYSDVKDLDKVNMQIYELDVIILSQTCDLVNDPPLDQVLVASIDDIKDESKSFIFDVHANNRPPYHLLHKKDYGNIKMNYMIVDFASTYQVPAGLINAFRKVHGPRVRLNNPYLEYLSQRFGNYFARVALPLIINKDVLKKDING